MSDIITITPGSTAKTTAVNIFEKLRDLSGTRFEGIGRPGTRYMFDIGGYGRLDVSRMNQVVWFVYPMHKTSRGGVNDCGGVIDGANEADAARQLRILLLREKRNKRHYEDWEI